MPCLKVYRKTAIIMKRWTKTKQAPATIRRAFGAVRGSVAGVAVVERSSNAYENW